MLQRARSTAVLRGKRNGQRRPLLLLYIHGCVALGLPQGKSGALPSFGRLPTLKMSEVNICDRCNELLYVRADCTSSTGVPPCDACRKVKEICVVRKIRRDYKSCAAAQNLGLQKYIDRVSRIKRFVIPANRKKSAIPCVPRVDPQVMYRSHGVFNTLIRRWEKSRTLRIPLKPHLDDVAAEFGRIRSAGAQDQPREMPQILDTARSGAPRGNLLSALRLLGASYYRRIGAPDFTDRLSPSCTLAMGIIVEELIYGMFETAGRKRREQAP